MGADLKVTEGSSFVQAISGVADMKCVPGAVNMGEVGGLRCWFSGGEGGRRPRHTLSKWPTFLHMWQVVV